MKLLKKLIIVIASLILLVGCSSAYEETSNKIARPENKAVPLQGRWVVEIDENDASNKSIAAEDRKWEGKVFDFQDDSIIIDGTAWNAVNYKIRIVNAEEYFLHKYTDALKSFEIKSKEIQVITASSQDKYLYEFIKLGNDSIIANIDSRFFSLVKAPEGYKEAGKVTEGSDESLVYTANVAGDDVMHSGLLLGVRIPEKATQESINGKLEQYSYKTYWISAVDKKLNTLLWTDDIYLPRKDGFWELGIQQILGDEGIENIISAKRVLDRNVKKAVLLPDKADNTMRMETKIQRIILYVGNDFICTENIETLKKVDGEDTVTRKVLRTTPVDNLDNPDGLKLSDLTGDNGSIAMEGAISGLLGSSSNNSLKNIVDMNQEENFALYRKMGHWFFKGRLNQTADSPMPYVDFNINLIPPADMVAYDMLHVPWTLVKDRVPEATDAYTSPNSDMAVVLTRKTVLIYSIKDGELDAEPINKFSIPDGSAVIMAEWATGDYVANWEKSFIGNNKTYQVNSN